ncbi:MAG: hypothetical protein PHE04_00525 [Bacteroidales bacterium]|nr:hypothetical protein [Bacteroidales bacterium]MDD3430511.1 hypothetical protein [Bacteroidales bacterium]MDD4360839.1 hypothetical protein [Bacteroidales bacterium]MDD4430189.1 hypothetical protein [Bacteroidales bacterium]
MEKAHWQWNEDFLVFDQNASEIILKNDNNGALVSLSEAEYKFLHCYSLDNDYDEICRQMPDYHIEKDLFDGLTGKARQLGLLISSDNVSKAPGKSSSFKITAYFLFVRFLGIIGKLSGLKLMAECKGNLRFYKLCSLELSNTLLHKIAVSEQLQKALLPLYILMMVVLSSFLWLMPGAELRFSGFGMTHIPVLGFFLLLVLSIFACLFVHETGHYLCYMRYGGKSKHMGLGLMFLVFPVMYTHIEQVQLWHNKWRKIKLSLAGIFMDVLIALLLLNFLSHYHKPDLLALLTACLFYYYTVQLLSNLNVFFPGTDGYYVFEDLIGEERLFGNSYECFKVFVKHPFAHKISAKDFWYLLYFLIACINISLYWFMIAALMTFPLWSNFVLS